MNFVKQLIRLYKPRRILEIGTAIGYSALQMYKAYPSVKITTIERDEVRFEEAQQRIINHQLDNRIQLILGDASDVLQNLREKELNFDFVLIDAAKGQYRKFFDLSTKLLEENGVIITDNVLFKGYVFEDSNVPKRFQKMVQKIQAFNEYIIMHEDFTTE